MSHGPFTGDGPFDRRRGRRRDDRGAPPRRPPPPPPPEPPPRRGPLDVGFAPRGGNGGRRRGPDLGLLLVVIVALGLAAAIVVLFLPPLALLDDEADPAADTAADAGAPAGQTAPAVAVLTPTMGVSAALLDSIPEVPDSLRPVSPIYSVEIPFTLLGPYVLTLRLNAETHDQRNLGAYTFTDGAWQRLGPALLTADGAAASVEVLSAPANVAILRRLQFRDMVTGRLPAGQELHPEAANTITIINPISFVPAGDGSLLSLGQVETLPPGITQAVYPVVLAQLADADTINTVLASEQLRRQHKNNILLMVQTGRFDGVDIDYQFIAAPLREEFTEFITELADQLHRDDRGIMVSVPLPTRDASGLNLGAYDLAALGAAVDRIKLVPPRDQSIFRESLVAALPAVLNRVPREKILLTVSPHSVQKSLSGTQVLTQRVALGLASRLAVRETGPLIAGERVRLVGDNIFQDGGASGIFWDRFANMVSYVYPDAAGNNVTVWVENRFSLAFKLDLIEEFRLGGIAIDDVSADPGHANIWPVITQFLESGTINLVRPNEEMFIPVWEVEAGDLTGSGTAGWVVWNTPTVPGDYATRLIVSDGDVRVGSQIDVTLEP